MFLDALMRRNHEFLSGIGVLHQQGILPANTYALDLKNIAKNAALISSRGHELDIDVIAMMKQIGRNPDACAAVKTSGITDAVAVDFECGLYSKKNGLDIGHIGHLVQIPKAFFALTMNLAPKNWTAFSIEHIKTISNYAERNNLIQNVFLRVWDDKCKFYSGHDGGFNVDQIEKVLTEIKNINNIKVNGITSFPALLFNKDSKNLEITPNADAINRASEKVEKILGYKVIRNMPGTTSLDGLELLAKNGATQVEPGHGLTGTTPLSFFEDTREVPSVAYVSEVAHIHCGKAYVVGGGLYRDPVLGDMSCRAVAIDNSGGMETFEVEMPKPGAIDYYAILLPNSKGLVPPIGTTIVFGFRPQVFVTRGLSAGVIVDGNSPIMKKLYAANGALADMYGN
jgi:predicted amino acid racemase